MMRRLALLSMTKRSDLSARRAALFYYAALACSACKAAALSHYSASRMFTQRFALSTQRSAVGVPVNLALCTLSAALYSLISTGAPEGSPQRQRARRACTFNAARSSASALAFTVALDKSFIAMDGAAALVFLRYADSRRSNE
eukprot:1242553-Pleurochrysis_carterae.AAC.2